MLLNPDSTPTSDTGQPPGCGKRHFTGRVFGLLTVTVGIISTLTPFCVVGSDVRAEKRADAGGYEHR